MPYITREDGERFVIPSYRDTLSAKKPALLKKEILLLSASYGEYMAMQRKNVNQYEAAFSPETGYLLGETVWHYFKRPTDLIYCEAIPNTSEAILVIVKGGTVYLDGSFPIETIPEELIVFRTQQNNFDVYIYGDVPISETPEPGKFALDASSIKSFNVLPESAFAKLPHVKAFQLRLVDAVLKSHGIGVFPLKAALLFFAVIALCWMAYIYFTTHKKEIPTVFAGVVNPYQGYVVALSSPDPGNEIIKLTQQLNLLSTIPGWYPISIQYADGDLEAKMQSPGVKVNVLFSWASQNRGNVQFLSDGLYLGINFFTLKRSAPQTISDTDQVVAEILDRLHDVLPGNNIALANAVNKGKYIQTPLTLNFEDVNLATLALIGQQLKGLPLVLSKVTASVDNGLYTGSIVLQVLGN